MQYDIIGPQWAAAVIAAPFLRAFLLTYRDRYRYVLPPYRAGAPAPRLTVVDRPQRFAIARRSPLLPAENAPVAVTSDRKRHHGR